MTALRSALLALAAALAAAAGAWADDDDDRAEQDRVRELVESGRALPLADILAIVEREVPGDVIEVDLDFDDGAYVYEIEVLARNGRVLEVEVDAASGEILEVEED